MLVAFGGSILAGSKLDTIVLIVAGGSGSRFCSSIPKQYNHSILRRTILKFANNQNISAIQVVIREEDTKLYNLAIEGLNILPVVFGGKTRSESVKNGLTAIKQYNPELVLVHDANRPYITGTLINNVVNTLKII